MSESLALLKEALGKGADPVALAKATFQQASSPTTGLTNYDLEAAAKNLYPVLTPLRNEIARVTDGTGTQANWRGVTAINPTWVNPGVGEGQRGGLGQVATQDFFAVYKTLGQDNSLTDEAVLAAAGFDDLMARVVKTLLQMVMISEEQVILGSNASYTLPTTPTPTLAASATGGTIGASAVVSVICVALTYDGVLNSPAPNTALTAGMGISQSVTRTNTDGTTFSYNAGSAAKSASASVTVSAGTTNSVLASVNPVQGAYGYAWYAGPAGSELFAGCTRISQFAITALPSGTQAASALTTGNFSNNQSVHDGLLGFAGNPSNNSYFYAAQPGVGLTADGDGGIVEFDNLLQYMWDKLRLSPDVMVVSSQEMVWIRKKILNGQNGSQSTRFMFDAKQGAIVGGGMPKGYLNPFSMSGGPSEIPIMLHPNMVPGTVMFLTKTLPYPMNNIDAVMRIKCRRDYYQVTWPKTSRTQFYGVYSDQVLQHYFTPSIGVITNLSPV
ncbi:hypothetical protein [Acidiphilium angustum]|uniref:hypothetical protein n=1 Tax=Acidiphilium angustum TaxID=523 RepID=UPI0004949116|nr:hypothetical protein [Acidiphilium angustum]